MEALVLSTLLPYLAQWGSRVVDRLTGGSQPVNVEESIKLMQAETERLTAVAALDRHEGTPSAWVVDLRQAFRYVAAAFILVVFAVTNLVALVREVPPWVVDNVFLLTSIVVGWLFGERLLLKQPERMGGASAGLRSAQAPLPSGNPASGGR